jgi:hypothetical protein
MIAFEHGALLGHGEPLLAGILVHGVLERELREDSREPARVVHFCRSRLGSAHRVGIRSVSNSGRRGR